MKALILAAGLGSRLAPITNSIPKSLVAVNGKPILFQQINCLKANGITDITVVVGYLANVVKSALDAEYADIHVIENKNYASTNNMFSAYIGMRRLIGEDFIMMNADIFFDQEVIRALLEFNEPNAVVVDIGRYIDESMKVIEECEKIIHISKDIPQNKATGCSIDVYKFSPEGGAEFYKSCRRWIEERGDFNKWSEVALDETFSEVDFSVCPLKGRWFEIDSLNDLELAEALFK